MWTRKREKVTTSRNDKGQDGHGPMKVHKSSSGDRKVSGGFCFLDRNVWRILILREKCIWRILHLKQA